MKILIMPNDLSNIDNYKDIDGFIVGIKGLSWFVPLELTIDDLKIIISKIKALNKKIFVSLNKLMYNQDIPLVKEYLFIIDELGIDGFLYDDLSILRLSSSMNIKTPLVWFGIHSFTNFYTANYWFSKGIKHGILSTEITLDHIKEISDNTDMTLMMYGYGYLPMFVSARLLLSSYFKHIKGVKENKTYYMYENMRKASYPISENDLGTIILSDEIINTIDELPILNEKVDYLILSSLNLPTNDFNKICQCYHDALSYLDDKEELKNISNRVKENSPARVNKGFLYKETIYKVKNDGER